MDLSLFKFFQKIFKDDDLNTIMQKKYRKQLIVVLALLVIVSAFILSMIASEDKDVIITGRVIDNSLESPDGLEIDTSSKQSYDEVIVESED